MIAAIRRNAVTDDLLIALAGTFNLAALAVIAGYTAAGVAVGASLSIVLILLMIRWAWLIPVMVIVGFAVQPALKFFITPNFGPAKDGAVLIAIAAVCATLVRRRLGLRDTTRVLRRPDPVLIVGVLGFMVLYAVNPDGDHALGWANGARLVIEAFSLLLLGYLGPSTEFAWPWVVRSVLAMGVIETVAGLGQQALGVNRLVNTVGYVYGDQVREVAGGALRSFGTLDDPFNYASLVLLVFIVVTQTNLRRRWALALALFIGVGVLVSFDRTDIVLLVLAAALWLVRHRFRLGAATLVAVTVVLAGAYVVTSSSSTPANNQSQLSVLLSGNGRINAWSAVLSNSADLVGGRGVGTTGSGLVRSQFLDLTQPVRFSAAVPSNITQGGNLQNLDSSYLATLADVGLVGLTLLLFIGGRAVVLAVRMARRGSSAGWIALGTVLLMLLDSLTRTSLTAFPFGYIAMYVLGAALAAGEVATRLGARSEAKV